MNNGCIQIHRKIMDSQVWKNPELFKVFCWCILRANYTDRWVTVATGRGETTVHIKRGQFIFGRLKAAEELNMKPSSVRNRMAKLKKMQNVDIQPDTHFSIVTICNYELYQWEPGGTGQADGQAKDNQRTTKGQPKDTDNKDNKDNNVKKRPLYGVSVELAKELRKRIFEQQPNYRSIPDNVVEETWACEIERMFRIDGRDEKQARFMLSWLFDHNEIGFVVESGQAWRKKWDRIAKEIKKWKTDHQKKGVHHGFDKTDYGESIVPNWAKDDQDKK